MILGGIFLGVVFIVKFIVGLKTNKSRLVDVSKKIWILGWGAAGIYCVFMVVHGLNYNREPVAYHFDLTADSITLSDIVETGEWLIAETNLLRHTRSENENKVFEPQTPLLILVQDGYRGYEEASVEYSSLSGTLPKPKPILLSHLWSYSRTTGVYFALLSEVNINMHPPSHEVLDTVLHELAHSKGYAREDEANFVAFITGLYHPDADYKYSVFLQNTKRILAHIRAEDENIYSKLVEKLSEEVLIDLQASHDYWSEYKTIVGATSTIVNNIFLKTNMQSDGIKSYGRVVDLIANWYLSHLKEESYIIR